MIRFFSILFVCLLGLGVSLDATPIGEVECPDSWDVYPCTVGDKVVHLAFPEPPAQTESELVTYFRANLGDAQYCLVAYKQSNLNKPDKMLAIYKEMAEECFTLKPRSFEDIVIVKTPGDPTMLDISTFAKDTILRIKSLDMQVHDRSVISFSDPYFYSLCCIQPTTGPDHHRYFFHSFHF